MIVSALNHLRLQLMKSPPIPRKGINVVRFVVLSDTHGQHFEFKKDSIPDDGDVLLHLGDVADRGNVNHIRSFTKWLLSDELPLSYRHKIIISGNHDRDLKDPNKFSLHHEYRDPAITFLDDEIIDIEGIKILGLSWDSNFSSSILKTDTPIHLLLTHNYSKKSKVLSNNLKIPIHLFGHYHRQRGIIAADENKLEINCCSLPSMEPVIIDLKKNTGEIELVHLANPSYFAAFHEPTLYKYVDF